jgi:hypothetical protein
MATPEDIAAAYEGKYTSRNPTMVIKALDYYHDINFNEPIEMLDAKYKWEDINKKTGTNDCKSQQNISEAVRSKVIQAVITRNR